VRVSASTSGNKQSPHLLVANDVLLDDVEAGDERGVRVEPVVLLEISLVTVELSLPTLKSADDML
jgi:hypothetical protein